MLHPITSDLLPGYGSPEFCAKCGNSHHEAFEVHNRYCTGETCRSGWWWLGYSELKPVCPLAIIGQHIHRRCERCRAEYAVKTLDSTVSEPDLLASIGADGVVASGNLTVPDYNS